MLPAETPPADFAETQYVDSRGCAFVRAAFNGQTTWLPQLDTQREPVCGLEPSLMAEATAPGRVVSSLPDADAEPETAEAEPETAEAAEAARPPSEAAAVQESASALPERSEEVPDETTADETAAAAAEASPAAPGEQASAEPEPPEVTIEADPDSPVMIIAAGERPAAPRHRLTVIERRGTIFGKREAEAVQGV